MAVGELFLSAFFQVLFDRLASAELLNFVTQEGVGAKLKKWEEKLKMIQAVLSDAEDKQLTDKAVKLWLDDLRDLAYDVEDILDEFATEDSVQMLTAEDQTSSTRKVLSLIPGCFTGLTPGAVKVDMKIGSKIKVISSRLDEIWENSSKIGLEKIAGGTSTAVWERPPSTCLPIEPAVYGRDEEKAIILGLVLDEGWSSANFQVISIVGMGGVGKTTLARLVYNDKAVEDFDLRAWVCVSHDFDVLRISQAILESITSSPCNLKELNQVQLSLKMEVAGRKFLIVLDDVWSKNSGLWKILRSPLMAGSPGSKVLVTTRSKDVALTIGPIKYRHDLKLLSDDDCWSVFEKHAFESRAVHAHQNLELIRQKVAEKCRGLPLAAATLGGLLSCKQRDDEWEDVLNSKIWDLSEESDILPALRLSYHHLPSHLKRCFAYCAIFPKHYEFEEKELVFLWMAEGLLPQSKHNKEMEHIGSEYFRELLSRSFFQPSSTEKHGERSSKFVMHDLVNDLAQWADGPTSLQLDDALRAKKQQKPIGKVRHFSYASGNYDGKNKFDFFHDAGCLRTFLPIFISTQSRYVTNMVLSDLLPKFKKLRVLSLSKYYITELPNSIGDLKHLRHLNLSDTMIKCLPESISFLYNLQILLLRGCCHLVNLPSKIRNLINLRHLDITGVNVVKEMPLGMNRLKFLQTLSNFIVGKGTGSSIVDLSKLKFLHGDLCVSGLENVTEPPNGEKVILSDMKYLEVLLLEWGCTTGDSSNEIIEENVLDMLQPHRNLKGLVIKFYGGKKFPSWLGDLSFSNIVKLALESCDRCTSLPSLGLLSSLKHLIIRKMREVKCIGSEFYGEHCSRPFQSLETLCFQNLQQWVYWDSVKANEHIELFPCLRELSIVECPNLLGKFPNHLPSLQKLVINGCQALVVSLSSVPKLCKLDIDACRSLECSSSNDFQPLSSMNLSWISSFGIRLSPVFQEVEHLKINACEMKIIEGLHLFASLKRLCIKNCLPLVSFPKASLSILRALEIINCYALTSLPEEVMHSNACLESLRIEGCHCLKYVIRGQLPSSLKFLEVINCHGLQCLLDDKEDDCSSSSSSSTMMHKKNIDNPKTSLLEKLYVSYCKSLRCLSSRGQLPSTLKRLEIWSCLKLKSLSSAGQLPKELQYLHIDCCPMLESIAESFDDNKSLQYVEVLNCENLQLIPEGLSNLSHLYRIHIWDCPNLVSFPKEGLPNTNLTVLIGRCEKLKALPDHMHNLKSLQELEVRQCPSIRFYPEQGLPTNLTSLSIGDLNIYRPLIEWGLHKLSSLQNLCIGGCSETLTFPEMGMTLPASLSRLTIESFSKLKYLSSNGFQNLTCLEFLWLKSCPNLTSLPEVGLPSSLLQLYVDECPLLKSKCKRDKGPEWSKIADIPCVKIDGVFIYEQL